MSERRFGYRWTIVALLFIATTINYVDRQVLGILAPTLQRDLAWSETDYGDIVSWFSFVYALGFLGVGRVIDRVGIKRGWVPRSSPGRPPPWPTRSHVAPRASPSPGPRSVERIGDFPGGSQDHRGVVPEAGAGAGRRLRERRYEHRRDRGAPRGSRHYSALGMAVGVHPDGRHRPALAGALDPALPGSGRAPAAIAGGASPHTERWA